MISTPSSSVHQLAPVPLIPSGGRAGASRLPAPLAPIVGREHEIAAVGALLHDPAVRLVTLTGPGGVGKTRLALAVAANLDGDQSLHSALAPTAERGQAPSPGAKHSFPDGVVFVALAPIDDPTLVAPTVAQALGLRQTGHRSAAEQLAAALRNTSGVLLLDNFEHVLTAAPLVTDLLAACPGLKILATSRERLCHSGEHVVSVPPLSLSRETRDLSSLDSDAARLFIVRARAASSDFAATDADAPAIAEICRRLDGLPLAIELAAARIAVLPPQALLARLNGPAEYRTGHPPGSAPDATTGTRLPLLTGGPRDLPPRQQTLRDTIAWSHDLLSDAEQTLFRRLSVFVDGVTLEAADALSRETRDERRVNDVVPSLDSPSGHPLSTLDLVDSLVAKSLLRQGAGPSGEPRFQMLETIREFAEERLAASGEAEAVRRAHARCCLAFAERHQPAPFLPDDRAALDRLEAEYANLRAALTWLEEAGAPGDATRLTAALSLFWYQRGDLRDGRIRLEQALARGDAPDPAIRIRFAIVLGLILWSQDEPDQASDLGAEALALARAGDDAVGATQALIVLGVVAAAREEHDQATTYLEEAITLALSVDDARSAASLTSAALANLGVAVHGQGRLTAALAHHEAALAGHQALGSQHGEMLARVNLGDVALDLGEHGRAATHYRAALRLAWTFGEKRSVAEALEGLACTAATGDGHRAEMATGLMAAAARLRATEGIRMPLPFVRAAVERGMAGARAVLGEAGFAAAWAAGQALPLARAVAEALDPTAIPAGASPVALTPREAQILPLIAAGRTDREIAAALFLSLRTVENHVTRLLAKLHVRSRTDAVDVARAAGLLPSSETPPNGK